MKNNMYRKYSEEVFNREENYKKIMSNYKNKKGKYKKLLNIAVVILVIFTLGFITPDIYAKIKYNIEFKEYNLRKHEVINGAISDKLEDGYLEKVDMKYLEQDKIKIKVDSMLITDDHFQADINFEFEDDVVVDSERFSYSFIIYDEEKNVYATYLNIKSFYDSKAHANTIRNFCRDVGIKFDLFEGAHPISTHLGVGSLSAEHRNITSQIEMSATKEHYPKSKKNLY